MLGVFVASMILWQTVAAPVAPGPPPASQAQIAVTVGAQEVYEHLHRATLPFLRILPAEVAAKSMLSFIKISVVVDTAGRVVSASASREWNFDFKPPVGAFEQAESLVRELRYIPFERNGRRVAAKLDQYVQLLPPELGPLGPVVPPFPKIKDLKSVKITLERTECYGWCPAYRIEVRGDGTVFYEGRSFVACTGYHRGTVSGEAILEVMQMFEQANFFALRDAYKADSSGDAPTTTISIDVDGRRKWVVDSMGLQMGMPAAVVELEYAVDRLSGSERWIHGGLAFVDCVPDWSAAH